MVTASERITSFSQTYTTFPAIPQYYFTNANELIPAPSPRTSFSETLIKQTKNTNLLMIEIDEAKDLFFKNVKRGLPISDIEQTFVYRYLLKTQSEGRKVMWKFEPFANHQVSEQCIIPEPWDIRVPLPPNPFVADVRTTMIPETRMVLICHECNGTGTQECINCDGAGQTICYWCRGFGHQIGRGHNFRFYQPRYGLFSGSDDLLPTAYNQTERNRAQSKSNLDETEIPRCTYCKGEGRRGCLRCDGSGKTACMLCKGKSKLIYYVQLTVEWRCYENDAVIERIGLPHNLIETAQGELALEEEGMVVRPPECFPDPKVIETSTELIERLLDEITQLQKIIRQYHSIMAIPVVVITYVRHKRPNKFIVYGLDKKIYYEKKSQLSCCMII